MKQEIYKNMYQQICMTEEQKNSIWRRIQAEQTSLANTVRFRAKFPARAAVCAGVLLVSGMTVLAAGERCIRIAQSVLKRCRKEGVDFTLVNARFIKPLDQEYLFGSKAQVFITLEDNVLIGGLGDSVRRLLCVSGKTVKSFGYGDAFIPHGGVEGLMREFGLDEDAVYECVKAYARG